MRAVVTSQADLEARIRALEDDLRRHQNELRYQERRAARAEKLCNTLLGFLFTGKIVATSKMTKADEMLWADAVQGDTTHA